MEELILAKISMHMKDTKITGNHQYGFSKRGFTSCKTGGFICTEGNTD